MAPKIGTAMPEHEPEYRAIFEASSDGLVINDLETGVVLEANPAFCRMHGYETMTGLHPTAFIHPESHHLFEAYIHAIQDGREFRCRARDVRRDHTTFEVEVLGRAFNYQSKSAMLGVVRDVTDEVRTYQALEQRVAERTREIERRRDVAESLRDMLAVVNSGRTLDEILPAVLAHTRRLLGSETSAIYLLDHAGTALEVRAIYGPNVDRIAPRIPMGMPASGLAALKLRPVAFNDLRAAVRAALNSDAKAMLEERSIYLNQARLPPPRSDSERRELRRLQRLGQSHAAVLAVPMLVEGQLRGTITLYYAEPREFGEEEVRLATAFADQAALAIENARLRAATHDRTREAEQRLHELEALYRADEALHRSLQLEDVLQALCDLAAEILQADKTAVWTWDDQRQGLTVSAAHAISPEFRTLSFPIDEGATRTLTSEGIVVVEDLRTEHNLNPEFRAAVDREGVRSYLSATIRVADQVFGSFAVGYGEPRTFAEPERRLVLALAQRAGLAIENARLYQQSEQRRREMELLANDNARLHQQATRRLQEIEGLYVADEQIYRSLRLDEVLQTLVAVASDLFEPDKVSLRILDDETGRVVVGAERGFTQTTIAESLTPDEGRQLREYLVAGVLRVNDAQRDPRVPASVAAANRREGIRSSMAAPIRIGSEVVGAFGLGYCQPRTFSDEEQRLLAALAQRAAMAIQNARVHEQSEQRRQELEALYQADAALHRSLRLQDVLEALVDAAIGLLQSDCAGLWGPHAQDASKIVPLASRGLSSEYLREAMDLPNQTAVNEWWFSHESFGTEDALHDPRFPPSQRASLEREGYRGLLSTQVRVGDQVFGSFTVGFRSAHNFGPTEKRLLATLAQRAGLAIQNARLHEESEQRRQELEALYHADEALHQSLRLDEVLQTLVNLAAVILSAEKTIVWILSDADDRVVVGAAYGVSPEFRTASFALDEATFRGGPAWGDIQVVEDLQTVASVHPRMRAAIAREGVRAWVSATIRTTGQVFGSFSAAYMQPRAFTEQERRLVLALAQRAALAIQNARLYEQAQQAATLEERQRLARELHDAVTQTLFSTALIAEVIPELWELDPVEGRRRLEELRRLTRGALAEMRTLLVELRPGALTELPLEDLLRQLGEATAGRTRLEVTVHVDQHLQNQIPAEVRVALYRIAQEALNNTVKHARAQRASVCLGHHADGEVSLRIEDDGRGFDATTVPAGHLGVGIMRERAQAIGATLRLVSAPDAGTRIELSWREREEKSR